MWETIDVIKPDGLCSQAATPIKLADFALHQRRADVPRQGPRIFIFQPSPEMHPHHAFFEDAASVCVEHIMVLAPKERLSEPRGWAVIKPDDLRSGNHHRIGVSILFHDNQEGPADVWPGGTE